MLADADPLQIWLLVPALFLWIVGGRMAWVFLPATGYPNPSPWLVMAWPFWCFAEIVSLVAGCIFRIRIK